MTSLPHDVVLSVFVTGLKNAHAVEHQAKKEKNTLLVDQHPEHARKEVVVSHGERKALKENEVVKRGMNQWNCHRKN